MRGNHLAYAATQGGRIIIQKLSCVPRVPLETHKNPLKLYEITIFLTGSLAYYSVYPK